MGVSLGKWKWQREGKNSVGMPHIRKIERNPTTGCASHISIRYESVGTPVSFRQYGDRVNLKLAHYLYCWSVPRGCGPSKYYLHKSNVAATSRNLAFLERRQRTQTYDWKPQEFGRTPCPIPRGPPLREGALQRAPSISEWQTGKSCFPPSQFLKCWMSHRKHTWKSKGSFLCGGSDAWEDKWRGLVGASANIWIKFQ